jgi:hypothetical protein
MMVHVIMDATITVEAVEAVVLHVTLAILAVVQGGILVLVLLHVIQLFPVVKLMLLAAAAVVAALHAIRVMLVVRPVGIPVVPLLHVIQRFPVVKMIHIVIR